MKKKAFSDYKAVSLIIPVLLIAIWQITSSAGILNKAILPSPSALAATFGDILKDGSLLKNVLTSLRRVLLGYMLGASLGVLIGVSMGLSKTVTRLFFPLLEIMRPIPILAWVPVLILWAGIGETTKVITIAIGTFWSVLLNTTDGIRNVDIKYKEVACIFGKKKRDIIFLVSLPAALPAIFTGLRVGVGSAWLSVIGAEMVAASSGLGYFITYYREMMKPEKMYAGVIVIGVIGWIINVLIRKLEDYLLRWNSKGKE